MSSDVTYCIADANHIKNRVDELKYRSEDIKSRLAPILKALWNPERTLGKVPEHVDLSGLRKSFPHFEEVIDFYENSIISLSRLNFPLEVPPILLQGDPGLGKTYFASELAKSINLPFFEISLATTSASFSLSGGNLQWAEGSTGFIANTLAKCAVANPIVLIDEVDKVSPEFKFNPLNVFYGLLESHSAKRFRDEALEVELDASKIIWIATGNSLYQIPAPIQSRLRVFTIQQPNASDMQYVISSIYEQIIANKTYGKLLDSSLNLEVITSLENYPPRTVKLAIEEGAFKAIRHQRSTIDVSDLPKLSSEERNRVGFI